MLLFQAEKGHFTAKILSAHGLNYLHKFFYQAMVTNQTLFLRPSTKLEVLVELTPPTHRYKLTVRENLRQNNMTFSPIAI